MKKAKVKKTTTKEKGFSIPKNAAKELIEALNKEGKNQKSLWVDKPIPQPESIEFKNGEWRIKGRRTLVFAIFTATKMFSKKEVVADFLIDLKTVNEVISFTKSKFDEYQEFLKR